MDTSNEEASDTGYHGSRDPVADSSAMDMGAIVDEQGTDTDNDRLTILVPFKDAVVYCPGCNTVSNSVGFLMLKDLIKHVKEEHQNRPITWECSACGRGFPGPHNVLCHYPKCKGRQVELPLEFLCTECPKSFRTARGLSIHEMHKHPIIRNSKRQDERERTLGVPGRRAHLWTEEETEKLVALNELHKKERYPNVKIKQHFPDKTLKQISDKRKTLRDAERRNKLKRTVATDSVASASGQVNTNINTAGESGQRSININTAGGSESAILEDASLHPTATNNNNLSVEINEISEWTEEIKAFALSIKHYGSNNLQVLDKELNDIIENINTEPDALIHKIDKIIEEGITRELLDKNEESGEDNSKAREILNEKASRNGKRRKRNANHITRARFSYARCQDLFKNCPKKLADIAISGD
ncbi:hypothetical protein KM043_018865, partial [Ampulex compressa]